MMRHSAACGEEIAVKKIIALLLGLMMLCSLACAKEATSAPAAEKTETKEETNVDKTHPIATITMKDGGVIELELYPEIAPESVKNFISLANSGFYDGLIFHRVIAGFMIQGGDPDGRGTGGPGYCIKGEFSANGVKNDLSHLRGVISMARAQPFDSAGSQFFICHADSQFLDGQYAAFGKVTSGLDVVDRIAKTTTDSRDKPYKDQIMETVRVETWGVEYGEPEKLPGK
jgi:peptidyl-prolyl cis-trans isomerase B (cyclophilin B)